MTPDLSRPRATPPYDILPAVPSFSLTSEDLADGERMGDRFRGAGESDDGLAAPAFHVRNDAGTRAWFGPYPPAGDGDHRYVFAVHALDVDTLGLDGSASAAAVACQVSFHALGRALLTATYSVPGDRAPFITEEPHA